MMIKRTLKTAISLVHSASSVLDKRYLENHSECEWPPIFIIGAPRSGTTLLYQLLMTAFKFSYFPNISNRWYMCPITAAKGGQKRCAPYTSSFSSTHGYEDGCMSPSEAGSIWNRWFPHENIEGFNYTPSGWLDEKSKHEIYRLVANIEHIFHAPFITKNVKMSVRIAALHEIFPKAIFLVIHRDMRDVVFSNIVMRRKRDVAWASVMPKEIDEIRNMEQLEQVCRQVYYVEENLQSDLKLFPESAIYHIDYKELCSSPTTVANNILNLAKDNDIMIEKLETNIPDSFNVSHPKIDGWIVDNEIEKINTIIDSLRKNF